VGAQNARAICLTIEDDGKGGDLASEVLTPGMGLINMRERVAALGGTIDFLHPPGGGLKVQVVIPAPAPSIEARLQ
jgi:signal transduction histidine kinase